MEKITTSRASLWTVLGLVVSLTACRKTYQCTTKSMLPAIFENEKFRADSISEDERKHLKLGQILMFISPRDNKTLLVQRLVGLAGDRITAKGPEITVNGKLLRLKKEPTFKEKYLLNMLADHRAYTERLEEREYIVLWHEPIPKFFMEHSINIVVPEKRAFFLGDYRSNVVDSRLFGFVNIESIVGRPIEIVSSPSETGERSDRLDKQIND